MLEALEIENPAAEAEGESTGLLKHRMDEGLKRVSGQRTLAWRKVSFARISFFLRNNIFLLKNNKIILKFNSRDDIV